MLWLFQKKILGGEGGKTAGDTGFALGFIFLSPPFSPIRFFCAIFLNLEPDFGSCVAKKGVRYGGIFRKKSSSLTPLILVDYSTNIDTITMEQSFCI